MPLPRHTELVNWLTDLIVPLVAVIGSLFGILVALDQITAAARLRRQATFWREMASKPTVQHDAEVLHSLEREATARVIALHALPSIRFLIPVLTTVVAGATAFVIGFIVGQIPSAELSWDKAVEKTSEQGLHVLVLPLMAVTVGYGTMLFVNVILHRSQIAKTYLDANKVTKTKNRRDDRTPIDALGWKGVLELLAFALGATCIATAAGVAAGFRTQTAATPLDPWFLILVAAGVPLLFVGLDLFVRVQYAATREWRHPRQLPAQHRRPRPSPARASRPVQIRQRPRN